MKAWFLSNVGRWEWNFWAPKPDLLAPPKNPHPSPVIRVGHGARAKALPYQIKQPKRLVPDVVHRSYCTPLVPCSWWGSTLSIEPAKFWGGPCRSAIEGRSFKGETDDMAWLHLLYEFQGVFFVGDVCLCWTWKLSNSVTWVGLVEDRPWLKHRREEKKM